MQHRIFYDTVQSYTLMKKKKKKKNIYIYCTIYKNKTQRVVKVDLSAKTQIFQTYDSTLVNTVLYSK